MSCSFIAVPFYYGLLQDEVKGGRAREEKMMSYYLFNKNLVGEKEKAQWVNLCVWIFRFCNSSLAAEVKKASSNYLIFY